MKRCNLIIDSCCDLPADLIRQEQVYLLRFPYVLNGVTIEDDLFQTTSAADFYGGMRKGDEPSTSQLSVPALTAMFEQVAETGIPSVYLSFSSGLSGSFDVAMLVRDQVLERHPGFELHVVDSHSASVAEGLLVYDALRQHERGLSAAELAQWAEEARYFVNELFMVEDLKTLKRGGRIPGTVAVAGAALDVKPLLNIDVEGRLNLVSVARGRKKGIKQLVEYFEKRVNRQGTTTTVMIGHADCPKDAQRLREALEKVDDSLLIVESNIGPVIGSHVGPGMLAVVFWGVDKRESMSVADRIARKVKGGQ